ncbi:uncharacterized protein LOC130836453 [Hippopotamus amphibius kiboko]|uniref:uncharacterized protein LOC130836453 n=1 Tax=Hippopotamus amphibius kiboko TaxID=575201 RepID=UPI0025944181|nr:uncharacterized protein LOC130836453 [Hippopotamus amphibius kiboko]
MTLPSEPWPPAQTTPRACVASAPRRAPADPAAPRTRGGSRHPGLSGHGPASCAHRDPGLAPALAGPSLPPPEAFSGARAPEVQPGVSCPPARGSGLESRSQGPVLCRSPSPSPSPRQPGRSCLSRPALGFSPWASPGPARLPPGGPQRRRVGPSRPPQPLLGPGCSVPGRAAPALSTYTPRSQHYLGARDSGGPPNLPGSGDSPC